MKNNLQTITENVLKQSLPKNRQHLVTKKLVNKINVLDKDPAIAETMRDNFLSHLSILKNEAHHTLDQYEDAVRFVTYILMGKSTIDSYCLTFPKRYNDLLAKGKSKSEMSNYASMYKGGKLVAQILEQAMIPAYVYNQDIFQRAIYVSADLMQNAKSEMVRQRAANSLLEHLKRPEIKNVEINVPLNEEDSGLSALRDAISNLAQKQSALINSGATTREIAESNIIEVVPNNVD